MIRPEGGPTLPKSGLADSVFPCAQSRLARTSTDAPHENITFPQSYWSFHGLECWIGPGRFAHTRQLQSLGVSIK